MALAMALAVGIFASPRPAHAGQYAAAIANVKAGKTPSAGISPGPGAAP